MQELKDQVKQTEALITHFQNEKSKLPNFVPEAVASKIDQFIDGLKKQNEKTLALIAKEEKQAPLKALAEKINSLNMTKEEQKKKLDAVNARYREQKALPDKQKVFNEVTKANAEYLETQKFLSETQMKLKHEKEILKMEDKAEAVG